MRRQIRLSAAIIGIAIAVMTAIVIGVVLYVVMENHEKVMAAECVHDVTEGFPGVDLSEEETMTLILRCEQDPEAASDAMFSRYLRQIVESSK